MSHSSERQLYHKNLYLLFSKSAAVYAFLASKLLLVPGCPEDTGRRTSAGCEEVLGGLQGSCALALHLCSGKKRKKNVLQDPEMCFPFVCNPQVKLELPDGRLCQELAGCSLPACASVSQTLGCFQQLGIDNKTQIFRRFPPFTLAQSKPERIHLPAFPLVWRVARR